MSLTIRNASPADLEFLAHGNEAMALETEHKSLDPQVVRRGVAAALADPAHGRYFVAVDADDLPVGQLMVTYEWSDWRNGAFWWIQSVYVDPAWRRQSVFRRMHETVMATAKTSPNVCGVRLYVEGSNSAAQAVYRKVGLTPSSYAIFETDFVLARSKGLEDRPNEA